MTLTLTLTAQCGYSFRNSPHHGAKVGYCHKLNGFSYVYVQNLAYCRKYEMASSDMPPDVNTCYKPHDITAFLFSSVGLYRWHHLQLLNSI